MEYTVTRREVAMDPSPRILFVDHDPSWSRPLRADLRRRGARVELASSERELQHLADGPEPDACILSDTMGEPDGVCLDAVVQQIFPGAAIIVSSPGHPARERQRVGFALDELFVGRLKGPSRPRPVVLCVDDDPFYLASLKRLLTQNGYTARVYDDPERALEAVPELEPDVAIVDIRMPGMSGLDLTTELNAEPRHVPVVVLSALGTDADVLRAHQRGAKYYLTKPCDPRRVLNAVDYFVGDLDPQERASLEAEL